MSHGRGIPSGLKPILTLVVFALIPLLIAGCSKPGSAGGPGGPGGGGVPVEALRIDSENIPQFEDYQATLISRRSVMLQPRVAGQISEIYVQAGQRVAAGAPLIQIDARQQQAALTSSQADAAAMQAAIKQAQDNVQSLVEQRIGLASSVDLNEKLVARYKNLYAKGAVSLQELDQYSNALDKAKSDLEANQAQIQAQRSAVATAKKNYERSLANTGQSSVLLQFYKITAPFAGTVGDIPVKVGTYVSTDTQLLSVTENQTLELNINLPADKAFDARSGIPVEVLDNHGEIVSRSKLAFVSPLVDPGTQTILVKAILNNPDTRLKANQSVKARVYFSNQKGFLVPTGAVSHLGGQDFVFMINKQGDKTLVKQQPVKVGALMVGTHYVVSSGLKVGDVIVATGIQKLMDGVPVTVLPQKQATPEHSAKMPTKPEEDSGLSAPVTPPASQSESKSEFKSKSKKDAQ
ncbi:MAG: efflux RND transporter periplasmic adaptor subunit [Vampirovibrionales bacterium]|nr:efflux RND transporter periplasmic adaptor subunit [Vampirovibrionales bacterium]